MSSSSTLSVPTLPGWVTFALKGGATLLALAGLVWFVDPERIFAPLTSAHWGWAVGALLLLPVNLGLDAWVWGTLLRPVTGRQPISRLVAATLSGFAVGLFTPARIGEYAGRAFYLTGADRWTITTTIFAQRMVDLAVAVGVGTAALGVTLGTAALPNTPLWYGVLGAGSLVTVLWTTGMIYPGGLHRLGCRLFPSTDGLHRRTRFLEHLTPFDRIRIGVGSLVRYGVYSLQFVLLGLAFAPQAPALSLWAIAGCTFLIKFLVPGFTLMDLGIREGAAVFFFGQFGLPPAAGLHAALVLFGINLVLPSALGLPFVWKLRNPLDTR